MYVTKGKIHKIIFVITPPLFKYISNLIFSVNRVLCSYLVFTINSTEISLQMLLCVGSSTYTNINDKITDAEEYVLMLVTFFCKRDRHSDCPGEWPVGESCNSDHDCSFDIRMTKCECDCHRKSSQ